MNKKSWKLFNNCCQMLRCSPWQSTRSSTLTSLNTIFSSVRLPRDLYEKGIWSNAFSLTNFTATKDVLVVVLQLTYSKNPEKRSGVWYLRGTMILLVISVTDRRRFDSGDNPWPYCIEIGALLFFRSIPKKGNEILTLNYKPIAFLAMCPEIGHTRP